MGRPRTIFMSKSEYQKIWWANHSDKKLEYRNKFKENNPEKMNEYAAKSRIKYPDKDKNWRLNNPDKFKASYTNWKQNNKEKVSCTNGNRRALKKNAEGSYSITDIQNLLERQNNLCNGCQIILTKYHVDHIHPLSKGGSNWPINLQILCPTCNTSKGDKTMDEWKPTERKAA